MTQDNDDLLAQVFSVLPPMEQHHEINGNNFKEDSKEEISANVRRVSNAFEDFLAKSGVVETQFQSVTESHSESHFQVMTTHVETHHEVVTSHHEEHHVEDIGHGAVVLESHMDISADAEVHEGEHHHEIGNGVSLISGEQLPPVHETFVSSIAIGHGAETEVSHIGHGVAVTEEDHFTIGHGVAPIVQDFPTGVDDRDSVVSHRTGLSQATSVSVHSSVSQKSIPLYADAPVIVQAPSAHHSIVSHQSQSTVKDSHHSDVTHTHDKESTISLSSVHSKNTEATLTGSHGNTYVFVERSDVIEAGSELSTPVAPLKSAPHDAVIEEFRQLHHRQPSEVSIPPAVPTSAPPPLDDEEENSSDVVMTVRVTQYEFDSDHVKNSVAVEHEHHEHHHHDDVVELEYHHHEVAHHQHEEDHHAHEHHDDHHHENVVEHITHVAIGEGAQVHHEPAIGEGVQLTHIHHLESDDDFKFEEVEYHEHHEHVEEKAPSVVSSVIAKSEPPPVFFQSPVLSRRAPSHVNSHIESDSSDDETIHGSEHEVVHHHHLHHEEHHHHHEEQHQQHHELHHHQEHVTVHKDLVPNLSRPHVRDGLRSAHVHEEYKTTTVRPATAPVAHVSPVVSQEKGPARIDHHEHLTPMIETSPIIHKQVVQEVVHTEVPDHHDHHHDHHEGEKHYHKHNEHVEEVFSGPSVRDLKSKFEHGGQVDIHYTSHYISHHGQKKSELENVQLQHVEHHEHQHAQEHAHEHSHHEHQHEHDHHHHEHHEHVHHHHEHEHAHQHHEHSHHEHQHHHNEEQKVHHTVVAVPHLPLRESPKHTHEEHHHHHHHHEAGHKHHHRRHHHHHESHKHQHHEKEHRHHHEHHEQQHHHHHHDQHHQEHVEQHVQQQVEVVEQHHHHHVESVHAHETHHEHVVQHVVIEKAVEEDQLPVSDLLSMFGGGAKLRRPDHVEEIKIYSRSSSVHVGEGVAPVVHHVEEPLIKSRTVTQSTVSTKPTHSQSTYSVQSTQRSHASTLTQSNAGEVHVHETPVVVAVCPTPAPIAVCPPAPVAAARSTSGSDHNSVRVVKSVRAFVNQWGQKDFKPPTSPVISVPRLPSSPQGLEHPEPTSRKSTIVSHVSSATGVSHRDNHVEKVDRSHSVAYSEANSVAHSEARSVARSEATSVASSKTCDCCSICGISKATSKASSKRPSVASQASTVTTTTYSVHKSPETFVETTQVTAVTQQPIPEVCEEFVLTPLADRRAMFEHGVNRGYSIRRNLHGELRPMVNVFTD